MTTNRELIRLANAAKSHSEYELANIVFAVLTHRFLESGEDGPVRHGLTYEVESEEPYRKGSIQPLMLDLLVVHDARITNSGRTYSLNIPAPMLRKEVWDSIVSDAPMSKRVLHRRKLVTETETEVEETKDGDGGPRESSDASKNGSTQCSRPQSKKVKRLWRSLLENIEQDEIQRATSSVLDIENADKVLEVLETDTRLPA